MERGAELTGSIEILDFPGLIAVGEPLDNGEGTRIFIAIPSEVQKACDISGAVGNLYKDGIRGRHYRDKDGIESFDVRPLLHMGLEAADRAVGAGDYGIPGHLLWIRGGCEFVNSFGIHEHPFWNS